MLRAPLAASVRGEASNMGRISSTWALMGQSWDVLKKDKELLVFPLLSGLGSMAVLAAFFVPLFVMDVAKNQSGTLGALGSVGSIAVGFAYYFVTYSVLLFCNTAVIGCAVKRLRGGDPTLADGFEIGFKRLPQIFGWAIVSTTVGMVLHALEQHKVIGRIVSGLLGAAWNLMTFFAMPILVVEGKGPIDALKESSAMLKSTWGDQVRGGFSFGLIFILLMLPCIGVMMLSAVMPAPALAMACIVLGVMGLLTMAIVHSALFAIFRAALYLHAKGETVQGFEAAQLAGSMAIA
jgi:hypothetical protein